MLLHAYNCGPFTEASELETTLQHLPSVCSVLLFPLNDSTDNSAPGGGTHWSLLLADLAEKRTMHLDSNSGGGNSEPAIDFAHKVAAAVGGGWSHSEPKCPKQNNSFDCGVFCALFARCALQALSTAIGDGCSVSSDAVSEACLGLADGANTRARQSWLEAACAAAEEGD